ncbi:hypothetical protein [Haliea sp. E1-2-M8]|uniref:DODA-type extradiol aromatic ring-opening family dioxygenase n=1 Tax=Haliea sp. E1-2-M8 TaxID=3064706 RepID=UPI00351C31FE
MYTYSGFPPHTYALRYPAPGSPKLAAKVQASLATAGIVSEAEHTCGMHHGVLIPMKMAFPEADTPIVQLSLKLCLAPAEHLALGRAHCPCVGKVCS